ncbi:MAG TPA: YihY/virulence factor BrkB family protein [Blastocatellia bacterium]|nr:YihY/virulence factor BrkB family protein [Blastocatellia bacterium]
MRTQLFGGLSLKELGLRAWRESNEDDVWGGAAQLGYYFLLALFPMLIFLFSLLGFLPGAQENIVRMLARVVPGQAMTLVYQFLQDVVEHHSGGLLSVGLLGTLWAASSGVTAVMGTLNVAYDVEEGRPFWKVRLTALGLTVGLALLITGGATLIMFADKFSHWLAATLGLGAFFTVVSSVVGYTLGLACMFIGIELIYYFGPNLKQSWRWITPGAVFAAAGIILGSLGFSLYLRVAPSNSATYGSLGAVITLMLWLYLLGLVLLVGGEINSEIEHATRKPQVEKEPGPQLKAA